MGWESRLANNPARQRHLAIPLRRVWIDILKRAGKVVGAHLLGLEWQGPIGLTSDFSPSGTPRDAFFVDMAGRIACDWRFPDRPFRVPDSIEPLLLDGGDPSEGLDAFDEDLWAHREQVWAVEQRLITFPDVQFVAAEIIKPLVDEPFDFHAFTRQQQHRWRQCERKRRHLTEADAQDHAARPGHEGTRPYVCPHCGGWHVGHALIESVGSASRE